MECPTALLCDLSHRTAQLKHSNSPPWRPFIKCYTEVNEDQNSISKVPESRAGLFTRSSPTLIVPIQWQSVLWWSTFHSPCWRCARPKHHIMVLNCRFIYSCSVVFTRTWAVELKSDSDLFMVGTFAFLIWDFLAPKTWIIESSEL